jgi:single-strand DNA-binding protein
MNTAQLIGNLGADPEVKYFESGSVKATFTLYVNEHFKDKAGETKDRVNRFAIEVWGKTAEFAANYLHKGNRIAITGSLMEQTWQDNGENRSRVVVRANRLENLTPKDNSPTAAEEDF